MKLSHLLALGLIALIVFRLTQDVRNPPAPEPAHRVITEVIQRSGDPTITVRGDNGNAGSRESTDSAIKTILQRLAAAVPAASPRAPAPSDSTVPSQSPVPVAGSPVTAGPPPVPLSPREKLRIAEARRPVLTKEYGLPATYQGILRRHLEYGKIAVATHDLGECFVEEYEPGERQSDGAMITFEAWSVGAQNYTTSDGEKRVVRRLIYAAPPLPLWDKFGRPINRDVIPPDAVREAGIHTPTMLDKKK
jgi:hypothetical protein